MIEFGKTLREAREKKGLTTSQIAEQTHLLVQIVEDLEKEDFHRISAPIYGRGFVKLYCEAVGIEPKPLVDEFMAILNGEREPTIHMKEVALPPEEPAPAAPEPPKPPVYTQPEFGEPEQPQPQPEPEPEPEAVAEVARSETRDVSGRPEAPDANLGAPRQYHPDYARATFAPSVNFGRLAILAGGAIVLLVALFFGIRTIYRVTMTAPGETTSVQQQEPEPTVATPAPTAKPAEKPAEKPSETTPEKKPRKLKTIAPLYID